MLFIYSCFLPKQFRDVAACVWVDVGGLCGNHAGAALRIFAEQKSLADLLMNVGGGVGNAVVVEE